MRKKAPAMADKDLPRTIAVFPLAGALVFPRGRLPLHIFEPRYRAMIRDAMAGDRVIGMIQPRDSYGAAKSPQIRLFDIGGLGRISQCTETDDGRFLVALEGVSRFRITRELDVETPYRQVEADYTPFPEDRLTSPPLMAAMRGAIESGLKTYLDRTDLSADWAAVVNSDDETLINTLVTACPFSPAEKQALFEAEDLAARAELLLQIMQLAGNPGDHERRETLQ